MKTPTQKRKKNSQIVLEHLKEMIRNSQLTPGDKLPSEKELSEKFGVSRAPVREALSVLSASGLIESHQGGGSYLRNSATTELFEFVISDALDYKQILNLLEIRRILEAEASALAAERRTEKDLELIESYLLVCERIMQSTGIPDEEADFAFHHSIVQATHNPVLIKMLDDISELYRKGLHTTLKENVRFKGRNEEIIKEHRGIYNAVLQGHSKLAHVQAEIHLDAIRKKMERMAEMNAIK